VRVSCTLKLAFFMFVGFSLDQMVNSDMYLALKGHCQRITETMLNLNRLLKGIWIDSAFGSYKVVLVSSTYSILVQNGGMQDSELQVTLSTFIWLCAFM